MNPDNTDDNFRLQRDIPLMKNYAELAIEEKFSIKRDSTIYREHLYELEGFKEIIPKEIVESLKKGEPLSKGTEIDFPDKYLLVGKRGHERYPLEEMSLVGGGWVEGGLVLVFKSITEGVELKVMLDFMNEKLGFDPVRGFRIHQERSDNNRVKEELSALKFQKGILSNGHVEIWDISSEKRLGRSETCIPVNCFVNNEFYENEFKVLEGLLSKEGSGAKQEKTK